MALIKSVSGKAFDQLKNIFRLFFLQALIDAPADKSFLLLGDRLSLLFTYRLNKSVSLAKRYISQPITDQHHLLLVHHNAVRFFKDLGHDRMRQRPFRSVFTVDVIRYQYHRSRPIERIGRDKVLEPVRLHLHQQILHPAGLELKDPFCSASCEKLENFGIGDIDFLKIDTEGSENLVLEGLLDTLKNRDIKVIQFEYGYINIISKFLLYDFYQFFDELGYTIGKIYPKRVEFKEYNLKDENFFGPNYVAVKSSETDIIESLAK